MQAREKGVLLVGMFLAGFLGCAAFQWLPLGAGEAIAAPGDAQVGVVRATRFVLVDQMGQVRATMGAFDWPKSTWEPDPVEGKAMGLALYAEDGAPRVLLGTAGKHAYLDIRTKVGRAAFGTGADGSGMGLWCPENILRVGLGMTQAGNGGFVFNDIKGRTRMAAGMPPDAGVSCSLTDENGEKVWSAP
jgi:hypothetical protein